MISPSKQRIIQIDITNKCDRVCSNCTRFVGHHQKPFFMSVDQAREAIDSLSGYSGMVGIMGGEPTLHPDFAEIVKCLYIARPEPLLPFRYDVISDMSWYRQHHLSSLNHKKGLWTSLGKGYIRHYELIQDIFNYQCVNDHRHDGEHIALLIPYDELGIDRDEFVKYRDKCWVQNLWSSTITPKGAFFCEVAGALDMLFDGPGGWPVEPGWWRRLPSEFGDQLKWCDICSACLPVPKRVAREGIDDVSESIAARLLEQGSRKKLRIYHGGGVVERNTKPEPYLPKAGNQARVKSFTTVKTVDAVIVCEGYDDYLSLTLPFLSRHVDSVTVITSAKDKKTIAAARLNNCKVITSKRLHEDGAAFAKGKAINEGLDRIKPKDWVLLLDADIILPEDFGRIKDLTLNPGALYYTRRWGPLEAFYIPEFIEDLRAGQSIKTLKAKYQESEVARFEGRRGNAIEHFPFGYFQLFNVRAMALPDPIYPERSTSAESDDKNFAVVTYRDKCRSLPVPDFEVIHLPHGMYKRNWYGRISQRLDGPLVKEIGVVRKYVCRNGCTYLGGYYKVGDPLETDRMDVPRHFKEV